MAVFPATRSLVIIAAKVIFPPPFDAAPATNAVERLQAAVAKLLEIGQDSDNTASPEAPSMTQTDDTKDRLLDAALLHVPFDGWGDATLRAAISESGVDETLARTLCPRGAVDLALAFHARGDAAMLKRLDSTDLSGLRIREKITAAVRFRLEVVQDKEVVRRGTTLFSLPQYAGDGAKAIWGTCDLIWSTLGDTSDDVNWYTKRATLSAVYTATVLYWLGDDSPGHQATWDFLDRRIDNVMQIEKMKAQVRENPVLKPFLAGPNWLLSQIHAPKKTDGSDLPGTTSSDP